MTDPRSRIPTTDLRTAANRESRRPARPDDVTFAGQRPAASQSSSPRGPQVNMSSHTGLLLFAGTALIALRLFESGKLKRAWGAAITGPGTSPKRAAIAVPSDSGQTGGAVEQPGPTGNGSLTGNTSLAAPGAAFGGFSNPQNAYQNRDILPGSGSARNSWYHSLLGGSGPYVDTDYPSSRPWQPVKLPGGPSDIWTFEQFVQDNVSTGGVGEVWRDPQGHDMIFWHLGRDASGNVNAVAHGRDAVINGKYTTLHPGEQVRAGTQIGLAGFAEIWHLCVVTSQQARDDLRALVARMKG